MPMAKKFGRAVRLEEHGLRVQLEWVVEDHWASILNLKIEDWNPDEKYLPAVIAFECPFSALY